MNEKSTRLRRSSHAQKTLNWALSAALQFTFAVTCECHGVTESGTQESGTQLMHTRNTCHAIDFALHALFCRRPLQLVIRRWFSGRTSSVLHTRLLFLCESQTGGWPASRSLHGSCTLGCSSSVSHSGCPASRSLHGSCTLGCSSSVSHSGCPAPLRCMGLAHSAALPL
jgi:hypothetical protein